MKNRVDLMYCLVEEKDERNKRVKCVYFLIDKNALYLQFYLA